MKSCFSTSLWLAALVAIMSASMALADVALPPEATTLQEQYDKDLREKVDGPSDAALKRLQESYRVTLETEGKKAMAQGQLDATLVMRNETKRFAESPSVPDIDEPGTPPEIVRLRGFWRAEAARIAKARATALQPFQAGYVAAMHALEKELTRGLKIDEAKAVRTKTDEFVASIVAAPVTAPPPSAPPVAATPPPPPAVTPAPPVSPAAKVDELVIQAFIDGDSTLHVQKDKIWWKSGRAARPGRWSSPEQPTYVNGEAWMPTWPDAKRNGGGESSALPVSLSTLELDFQVLAISSDRGADEIEKRTPPKTSLQGNRLDISIPDPENGAKWYKFVLRKRH